MNYIWVLSINFYHCIRRFNFLLESQRAIRYSKLNDNFHKLSSKINACQVKSIIWRILSLVWRFLISHSCKLGKNLFIKGIEVHNVSIITKQLNNKFELGLFFLFDEDFKISHHSFLWELNLIDMMEVILKFLYTFYGQNYFVWWLLRDNLVSLIDWFSSNIRMA